MIRRWMSGVSVALLSLLFVAVACKKNNDNTTAPSSPVAHTSTFTPTGSATLTPTSTKTPTITRTPTQTRTPTNTPTKTFTVTFTYTRTATPTATITSTKTTTPTITPTPPPIEWGLAQAWQYVGSGGGSAYIYLRVNGSPVSTAGVTISGDGYNTQLPYNSAVSYVGKSWAYYSGSFTYQAGQTYVLSSATTVGTAAATFIAPGGDFTVNSTGTTVSWDFEGNQDRVQIYNNGTLIFNSSTLSTDISSPYTVPATVYNGYGSPSTFVFNIYTVSFESPSIAVGSADMYQGSASITIIK